MLRQSHKLRALGIALGASLASGAFAETPPVKPKAKTETTAAKPAAPADPLKVAADAVKTADKAIKDAAKKVEADKAKADKAEKAAATKTDKATDKADKASDKADKATDKADKASDKADKASDKADKAADKADKAADKAEEKADKATDRLDKAGEDNAAKGLGAGNRSGVRDLVEDFRDGKLKKDEFKARLASLKETRKERREQRREEVQKRHGDKLAQPAAVQELRHHARRMAFLNRMLAVAETERDGRDSEKLVLRIEKLVERENGRHERKMAGLTPGSEGGSK